MLAEDERLMANMLADPVRRVGRASEGPWPATGVQSEGRFDDPLATTVAMAFIGKFNQDRDQLAVVEQHQRVAVGAVGSDPYFVG